ncbi:adenylate/guanylate cyclase domain-containing protein [Flavisolibacter ginsengisoli]|jgi:adenylate cyclase|uniref:Adenylate cyclase, class 3 n=1 Tax=Flavisolibacter ginsengisoli DSM 18119 TaxID=1121884 RepID=A0A1M5FVF8_9BACT|nr:adenylate/guanylate cyclase domain-containing protein [Flavisolibacter ginsengisoli]SHF95478.1 Adenylate cyclase, class 3 [Flavisolibacter ginsengisoli DSM 18119]
MNAIRSYWVEFIGDRSIKVEEGQTILSASLAAGIPHYHACGGNAKCSTCRILVIKGIEHITPQTEAEKALQKILFFPPNVRLACQSYVEGSPIHVHRIIRDETDIHLYIDEDTQSDLQNIGEEKELALLFLDIKNFTPFIENYLAFDVIHVMRRLFGLFRKCIEMHAGQIIETAGDGLYAVFGFKEDITTSVNNASKAGLSILEELDKFNEQYLGKYFNHFFQVGIGLHAGNVIVGNVGIGVNNNLTVMGLPVNVASRLQAATRELNNSFVVSKEVYDLLEDPPASDAINLYLKGIKYHLPVYLVGRAFH